MEAMICPTCNRPGWEPNFEIPTALTGSIPNFRGLWAERLAAATRKPSASARGKQLQALVKLLRSDGPQAVINCVEEATRGGYQGIFPDKHRRRAAPVNDALRQEWEAIGRRDG